jgi:phage-related protein
MRYTAWQVIVAGEAVEAEIKALPADMQARYLRLVDMLQEYGPQCLNMPHARHIDGKLWELRLQGRDGIARAIYTAITGRRVAILHVFIKKTQKTPRQAIATAKRRLQELQP